MPSGTMPLMHTVPDGVRTVRHARRIAMWSSGAGPLVVICAAAVLMPDLLLRTVYGASSPNPAVAIGLQLLAPAGVLEYIAEMISKTLLGVPGG